MVASLATAAVTAGAGALANKFLGPKKPKGGASANGGVTNFSAGGLSGRFNAKTKSYDVGSTSERDAVVGRVSSTFGQQADALRGLREQVRPGFSDLRSARLAEVENSRSAAIGNLRENLQRRRVLGSSFGQDAIVRAEREFGQERDRITSETMLQELAATEALLTQEFEAGRSQFSATLNEFNLQAELAATLTSKATVSLNNMAQLEARLAAESASGFGKFVGDTIQPVAKAVGNFVNTKING